MLINKKKDNKMAEQETPRMPSIGQWVKNLLSFNTEWISFKCDDVNMVWDFVNYLYKPFTNSVGMQQPNGTTATFLYHEDIEDNPIVVGEWINGHQEARIKNPYYRPNEFSVHLGVYDMFYSCDKDQAYLLAQPNRPLKNMEDARIFYCEGYVETTFFNCKTDRVEVYDWLKDYTNGDHLTPSMPTIIRLDQRNVFY